MATCSDSSHQFPINLENLSLPISLYPLLLLNDVKEEQKRMSSLVIQQYDLEYMGKKWGGGVVCLLRKNYPVAQNRQCINSGSRKIFIHWFTFFWQLSDYFKNYNEFLLAFILSPSFTQEIKTISSKLSV